MRKSPSLKPSQARFLKKLFPGDGAVFSPEETLVFGADNSRRFAPPWAVVRPENEDQVRELLAFAHKERIPILGRGRGTNTVGGCTPVHGGVAVSFLRMNAIEEISSDDFLAVCRPGVITGDLQKACAEKGLFYPPDPASAGFSTIGGNAATCAGGMRAVKYGVTRDYVLGLRAVAPGGEIVSTGGRTHKNVAGLDLTRLLAGSEGTLALFTEITLKLLPLPETAATTAAAFAGLDDALRAAQNVFRCGVLPTAMELMTEEVLAAIAPLGAAPWPKTAKAALLLAVDGSAEAVRADGVRLEKALSEAGPVYLETAASPEQEQAVWKLRKLISPASFNIAPDKISDDATFPRGAVGEAVTGIREIAGRAALPILVFGHLGDGNLHVNIMHDASDPDQAARAAKAREHILDLTLKLRGTLSGEHGVGLAKLPYLPRQIGETELALMRRIKAAFDPHGIMNPGKAF